MVSRGPSMRRGFCRRPRIAESATLPRPAPIAPPTMAVIWEQRSSRAYVADPEAGIDYSRVVHGEESFAHHRPIVAGDELTATTRVDAIRQAGGHSMITVVTDLADAGGAPVCTASSTIVVRGGE